MNEPEWVTFARRFLGRKEIPGKESNTWIENLWFKLKASSIWALLGKDDSTAPWCGLFVGSCFNELGYPIAPAFYRARSWLDWGQSLPAPEPGCVVVFERKGGGHVAFVVGVDQNDNLMCLGGNQNDAVTIAPFSRDRVLGYRWPEHEVVIVQKLPLVESGSKVSFNEA